MHNVQANAPTGSSAAPRTFERVAVVRTLANRKVPSAIVHAFAPTGAEVVVVERHGGLAPADLDAIEADARATMTLRHPNVASVRDVWRENGEVAVATEFVEGETLEEVRRLGTGGKDLTLEVGVRVLVDVLAALSALHTLGAGSLAHGEITAGNVIVGFDGLTRVVRPYRGRVAGKLAEPDWFSYAAPEVIRGGPASVHADLYAVGVLLWETLSRRKLFPKATREGRAARTLPVGKPSPPADASWAAPLAAVAERALANDPNARYTSAAEMAAAVRLAVRSKLAMPPRVAAALDKLAGERIISRRNTNALPEAFAPRSGRPSRPSVPPEAVRALQTIRASSRPPPVAVDAAPPPAMPKAPPVPSVAMPPTPTPGPIVARPRPPVPAIKINEPTPVAPPVAQIDDAPISIDDALVEPAPPSVKVPIASAPITAPPVVAPAAVFAPPPQTSIATDAGAIVPAGIPTSNRRLPVILAAAALMLVLAVVVLVHALGGGDATKTNAATQSTQTAHPSAIAPPAITTATSTTTSAPAETAPTESSSANGAPSASASTEPDTSAAPDTTAAPEGSHRPHVRPRPTYDPMGI